METVLRQPVSIRPSTIQLIAANLFVAVTILSQQWGYYSVILIYWWEALIIGVYGLARMCVVCWCGEPLGNAIAMANGFTRLVLSAVLGVFFVTKFGGFAVALGFWVALTPAVLTGNDSPDGFRAVVDALRATGTGVALAAAMLFVSHGFSFFTDFVGQREFRATNVVVVLFKPYFRMALILAVLALAFVAAFAIPALYRHTSFAVVVVLFKTVADVATDAIEHRGRARR